MLLGGFLICSRIQVNWRTALRRRSAIKISLAAPRSWRKERSATLVEVRLCPQVLGAEGATESPIAAFGAEHHGCATDPGGSNVWANLVENLNAVILHPNENESPGESIGLLRKHLGGLRLLRSVVSAAQREGRIDDPNRERWGDLRRSHTRADASKFAEVVGACVSLNRGSFWRFESRYSRQLKNQLPLSRRLRNARISMAADFRQVAESSQCVHPTAIGSLGSSGPTELLPPLRPTLRRYRVTVSANSLRDPDERARNLPTTSVSTREGTERAPVSYAYSSSNRAAPPEGRGVGLRS